MKRFLTTCLPVLALGISLVNGTIIALAIPIQADRDHVSDWVNLLLPIVVVSVCFALSISVLTGGWIQITTGRAALWGAFVGGIIFLVVQAILLVPKHQEIAQDGTAYWAIASIPAFWLGLPLLAGAAVGYFWAWTRSQESSS